MGKLPKAFAYPGGIGRPPGSIRPSPGRPSPSISAFAHFVCSSFPAGGGAAAAVTLMLMRAEPEGIGPSHDSRPLAGAPPGTHLRRRPGRQPIGQNATDPYIGSEDPTRDRRPAPGGLSPAPAPMPPGDRRVAAQQMCRSIGTIRMLDPGRWSTALKSRDFRRRGGRGTAIATPSPEAAAVAQLLCNH